MPEPFNAPPSSTVFLASPLIYLLRPVYSLLNALRPKPVARLPSQTPIRVVCLSDTHNLHHTLQDNLSVPDGDLLIHAGDLTNGGSVAELQAAIDWLNSLPHPYKVVIAGNHDTYLDKSIRHLLPEKDREGSLNWRSIHYLENSSVILTINGRTLTLHGIPQVPCLDPSPESHHAFQYPAESSHAPFPPAPSSTDILISHSPPQFHQDLFPYCLGCPWLLQTAWAVKPLLYVHGHTHAAPGISRAYYDCAQRAWESLQRRRQEGGKLWERGDKTWWWWVFVRGAIWRDSCSVFWAWKDAAILLAGSAVAVLRGRRQHEKGLGKEGWIINVATMDGGGSGKLIRTGVVVEI
jgi:predicted phosphodiesterase